MSYPQGKEKSVSYPQICSPVQAAAIGVVGLTVTRESRYLAVRIRNLPVRASIENGPRIVGEPEKAGRGQARKPSRVYHARTAEAQSRHAARSVAESQYLLVVRHLAVPKPG